MFTAINLTPLLAAFFAVLVVGEVEQAETSSDAVSFVAEKRMCMKEAMRCQN